MTRLPSFDLSIAEIPIARYLTGEAKHKAQQHRAGFSKIKTGMAWSEYEAMDIFGIPTEDAWHALPRDERARKVGYVMSKSLISVITQYEAIHVKSKK